MLTLSSKYYPLPRPRFSFDASPAGEELAQLARRLATGEHTPEDLDRLRELPREDHEELKRLVARERETEDRRRTARDTEREAGERREFNPAITPIAPEEDRRATMAAARDECMRAGVPAMAMDSATSVAGIYSCAARHLGVDTRGHGSGEWSTMFRDAVAKGAGGFFSRFPGARRVSVAAYNDSKLGR